MSIPKPRSKIKSSEESLPTETFTYSMNGQIEHKSHIKRYFLVLLIILVSFLSFSLGRLANTNTGRSMTISYDPSLQKIDTLSSTTLPTAKSPVSNSKYKETASANLVQINLPTDGQVIASSKGTKYYYPYCKNNISNKNKIAFLNVEDAEKAGYTLATNCKVR